MNIEVKQIAHKPELSQGEKKITGQSLPSGELIRKDAPPSGELIRRNVPPGELIRSPSTLIWTPANKTIDVKDRSPGAVFQIHKPPKMSPLTVTPMSAVAVPTPLPTFNKTPVETPVGQSDDNTDSLLKREVMTASKSVFAKNNVLSFKTRKHFVFCAPAACNSSRSSTMQLSSPSMSTARSVILPSSFLTSHASRGKSNESGSEAKKLMTPMPIQSPREGGCSRALFPEDHDYLGKCGTTEGAGKSSGHQSILGPMLSTAEYHHCRAGTTTPGGAGGIVGASLGSTDASKPPGAIVFKSPSRLLFRLQPGPDDIVKSKGSGYVPTAGKQRVPTSKIIPANDPYSLPAGINLSGKHPRSGTKESESVSIVRSDNIHKYRKDGIHRSERLVDDGKHPMTSDGYGEGGYKGSHHRSRSRSPGSGSLMMGKKQAIDYSCQAACMSIPSPFLIQTGLEKTLDFVEFHPMSPTVKELNDDRTGEVASACLSLKEERHMNYHEDRTTGSRNGCHGYMDVHSNQQTYLDGGVDSSFHEQASRSESSLSSENKGLDRRTSEIPGSCRNGDTPKSRSKKYTKNGLSPFQRSTPSSNGLSKDYPDGTSWLADGTSGQTLTPRKSATSKNPIRLPKVSKRQLLMNSLDTGDASELKGEETGRPGGSKKSKMTSQLRHDVNRNSGDIKSSVERGLESDRRKLKKQNKLRKEKDGPGQYLPNRDSSQSMEEQAVRDWPSYWNNPLKKEPNSAETSPGKSGKNGGVPSSGIQNNSSAEVSKVDLGVYFDHVWEEILTRWEEYLMMPADVIRKFEREKGLECGYNEDALEMVSNGDLEVWKIIEGMAPSFPFSGIKNYLR